jgi:hypothetical protein
MIIELEVREDNDSGLVGLVPKAMRKQNTPDAGEGYQLAHDIVEHVNGLAAIGGIEDELEALGAIWLVRGQYHDLRRPDRSIYSPEKNIASDVSNLFSYWGGRKLKFSNTHEHWADESFECILEEALPDIRDTWDWETKDLDYWNKAALRLMRSGARKLARRFRHISHRDPEYAANTLFYNIRDEVAKVAKYAGEFQTFDLKICGTDARIIETTYDGEY